MYKKESNINLFNVHEFKLPFPMNLIYREIVYMDCGDKCSINLMHKWGLKYFNSTCIMKNPEYPGYTLVFAKIHRWETELFYDIMKELSFIAPGNYEEACNKTFSILEKGNTINE